MAHIKGRSHLRAALHAALPARSAVAFADVNDNLGPDLQIPYDLS